ncbi:MAG: hypothetical protein ACTS22_01270 [Phycisphaerales bacterium]
MDHQATLCVRCGYPARGLQHQPHPRCPECGCDRPATTEEPGTITETIAGLLSPRATMLAAVARTDRLLWPTLRNLSIACVLAAAVIVWTWLIDPIRGVFAQPMLAFTTLLHLVIVVASMLLMLGLVALACEHALVAAVVRLLRLAQPMRIAAKVGSISALSLAVIAGGTLVLVGLAHLTGLNETLTEALPAGGLVVGALSSLRTTLAGFWTAGLLRDAAW